MKLSTDLKKLLLSVFKKVIKADKPSTKCDLENVELTEDDYKSLGILDILKQVHETFPQLKDIPNAIQIVGEAQEKLMERSRQPIQKMLESGVRNGNDSCQKIFNTEIRRVRREYDERVRTYIIVTFATGGAGFVPCNAVNVYRASSNSHRAIFSLL